MRIIKNIRDKSLNEDEDFFAGIIKEEFGCNTCVEEITNKDFLHRNAQPLNEFTIYTTAGSGAEGARALGWKRQQ